MPPGDIALLSYPDVTPGNIAFFRAAAAERGLVLSEWEPHRISVWCGNGTLEPLYEDSPQSPAVIIHRTMARLQGIAVPALGLWQERGTTIVNDLAASVLSRDKLATAIALTRAGLPTVASLGFLPWEEVSLGRLPRGLTVTKPAHGLQGRGVAFFETPGAAEAAVRAIRWGEGDELISEHYLAQPAIGTPGRDIRAYVVGGACVALARRTAADPAEPRANIALGATAAPLHLDHPAAGLAVAATAAIGLDYAGVDLLETADGELQVLEVDAWAGFSGLQKATGADIAGHILDLAVSRLEIPKAPGGESR